MEKFTNSPFSGHLEIVATLRDEAIDASMAELRRQDDLTKALRQMKSMGVSLDDLSAASGLSPAEIERRIASELHLGEDLELLAGIV